MKSLSLSALRIAIGILLTLLVTLSVIIIWIGALYGWVGYVLLGLVVVYLMFSWKIQEPDEVGALFFWGVSVGDTTPGPHFVPLFFVRFETETANIIEDELPSDPENIFRGKDANDHSLPTPPGKFSPIRVKFGQPKDSDTDELKSDPYNSPMVVEVNPVMWYRIYSLSKFILKFGNIANFRRLASDLAEALAGDTFATMTPAAASAHLPQVSETLKNQLEDLVKDGGVRMEGAKYKPFQFSHKLNTAVVLAAASLQEAIAAERKAVGEAKAKVITSTAEADSEAIKAARHQQALLMTGRATSHKGTRESVTIKTDEGEKTYEIYPEIELLPDAQTKAVTEAVKALKDVKGTLVLGNTDAVLAFKQGGEQ